MNRKIKGIHMLRIIRIKSLNLFLVSVLTLNSLALDWPRFRATYQGDSHAAEVAYPPLTLEWSYDTFSPITASPIVADGRVIVGNHAGFVYVFDAYTGEVLWQYSAEGRIDMTACYEDGIIYVGSRNGMLYALDSNNKTVVWSQNLGTVLIASPIVYDGKLFIGAGSPSTDIKILDIADGSEIGVLSTNQPVQSSPSLYNGRFYVGSNDGAVYAGSLETLTAEWTHQTVGSFELSSPVADETGIYVSPGNDERKLYRLINESGVPDDQTATLTSNWIGNRTSSPGLFDGKLIASVCTEYDWIDVTAKLFAFDAADLSTELWSYDLGVIGTNESMTNPTITQNCVYTPTFGGKLMGLSLDDGTPLFEQSLTELDHDIPSQISVSNGWLYVGLKQGSVKAFKADIIVALSSPDPYTVISDNTDVAGSVVCDNLVYSVLAYGQGTSPDSWTTISVVNDQGEQMSLASWDTSSLTDGIYTLRLQTFTSPSSSLSLYSSIPLEVNMPPAPPTNLSLTEVSGGLKLTWSLSADDGAGDNDIVAYRIYRSVESGTYSGALDAVASGIGTYTDTSLLPDLTYYYVVRSYDNLNESENSNEVNTLSTDQVQWIRIPTDEGGTAELSDGTKAIIQPGTFDDDVWV
ncbi:MAG: PQQ-binding-like beta-propeller repeat protein, partial [Elusimicrobia bacterium]|nr:PQQ-binding-like beta-propeller repeat protein [Elusimicrobiota bacterium]MBD3412565.1 PQQ-binding-like beta-propeller repeat protein [Elusimicrobiota bacterium]